MLNLISGKQRSGKSYFCVTLIIDYLKSSDRHLYTNLPINPDLVADCACGGKLRYPSLYAAYLKRIHVFCDYSGRKRSSFADFKQLNPDFCKLYHSLYSRDHKANLLIPCGQGNFMIRQFWRYTYSNSVIFLDEVYEIFGSLDQLSKGRDVRMEMLSYAKQHGHFKDDLYLITHDPADLDKIIRKSLNRQFVVENAKYKNIFDHKLFKGLRWPIQFFIVKGYEYGERECQDHFHLFPKQHIFSCYNSFNVSDLLCKDSAGVGDTSSDTAVNHHENFVRFFKQAFPMLLMLLGVVVFFCVLIYSGYSYLSGGVSSGSSPNVSAGNSAGSGNVSSSVDSNVVSSAQAAEIKPVTVVFLSHWKLVLSNGKTIKRGDFYGKKKVVQINRNSIRLWADGSFYDLSIQELCRSEERNSAGAIK